MCTSDLILKTSRSEEVGAVAGADTIFDLSIDLSLSKQR